MKGVTLDAKTGATGDGEVTGGPNSTNNLWLWGNDSHTGAVYVNGLPVMGQVLTPQEWGYSAGAHFWAFFGPAMQLTAGNAHELADYGWTTTALSLGGGVTGDFISSADQGPPYLDFDTSGDQLLSPLIFGEYGHALLAKQFLGTIPTKLCMEVYASFPTVTADETTSGFGFAFGVPATATNQIGFIHRNTGIFRIRRTGTADDGPAVDNLWHLWKIQLDATDITWWQDGVSQGTITNQADAFPVGFGAHVLTTNRLRISWIHCYYEI